MVATVALFLKALKYQLDGRDAFAQIVRHLFEARGDAVLLLLGFAVHYKAVGAPVLLQYVETVRPPIRSLLRCLRAVVADLGPEDRRRLRAVYTGVECDEVHRRLLEDCLGGALRASLFEQTHFVLLA